MLLKKFGFSFVSLPGSGKGEMIKVLLNLNHHIGLRLLPVSAALKNDKNMRSIVSKYDEEGHLVPDEHAVPFLRKVVSRESCLHGLTVDGAPRSSEQADLFLEKFREDDTVLIVVFIGTPQKECRARMLRRTLPDGRKRGDDKPHVIRNRFKDFHGITKPAINHLRRRALESPREVIFVDVGWQLDPCGKYQDLLSGLSKKGIELDGLNRFNQHAVSSSSHRVQPQHFQESARVFA